MGKGNHLVLYRSLECICIVIQSKIRISKNPVPYRNHGVHNFWYFRVLVENGVKLSLTVIDTPGFGEAVDNTECWTPILDYIEDQFDAYLEAETRVERFDITDNRVHACLYFIAPTGNISHWEWGLIRWPITAEMRPLYTSMIYLQS